MLSSCSFHLLLFLTDKTFATKQKEQTSPVSTMLFIANDEVVYVQNMCFFFCQIQNLLQI